MMNDIPTTIFVLVALIAGLGLMFAPKKNLEALSRYYDTRNVYGDKIGKKMGTTDFQGNLITSAYPWVYRLLGAILLGFAIWLLTQKVLKG